MVMELQADTGKGLVVGVFVLAVIFLVVFTTSPAAALLGAVIAAIVLAAFYYLGVRFDALARGSR